MDFPSISLCFSSVLYIFSMFFCIFLVIYYATIAEFYSIKVHFHKNKDAQNEIHGPYFVIKFSYPVIIMTLRSKDAGIVPYFVLPQSRHLIINNVFFFPILFPDTVSCYLQSFLPGFCCGLCTGTFTLTGSRISPGIRRFRKSLSFSGIFRQM